MVKERKKDERQWKKEAKIKKTGFQEGWYKEKKGKIKERKKRRKKI